MEKHPAVAALSALALCLITPCAPGATGPVVSSPENVYDNCTVNLYPGTVTGGTWSIDWGDGTAVSTAPGSQTTISHTYPQVGIRQIRATLKNSSGGSVDVQQDYAALVAKTGPALHYHFNGGANTGPAFTQSGGVTDIASFAGNTGTAKRFPGTAGSYLRIADQKASGADFFGLEFWLRPNDLTTKQVIYAGVGGGDGNVQVYIKDGGLYYEQAGAGVKSIPLGTDVQAGRWYHFGVSFERSPYYLARNTLRFYRDGFLQSEQTFTAAESRAVNYTGATIGARDTGGGNMAEYLNGDLDEVVLHPLGVFPGSFLERYRAATRNEAAWRVASGQDGAETFTVDPPVIAQEQLVTLDTNAANNFSVLQNAMKNATTGTRLKIVDQNGNGGGTFKVGQSSVDDISMLKLENKTNVELDGNGALILVTTPLKRFLTVSGCNHVAVKNLSFDIDPTQGRPTVYAQVESFDIANKQFVLRFVKGAANTPDVVPAPAKMSFWRIRQVADATRYTKSVAVQTPEGENFIVPKGMVKTPDPADGSRWTIAVTNAASDALWPNLQAVVNAGDLLQITNGNFASTGTLMWNCQHLTFDKVNYYGVLGMVFLTGNPDVSNDLTKQGRFDYLKVSNCRIGLPPGLTAHDRAFASCADGFQFYQASGGHLLFENNDLGMTNDDPIVIKDPIYLRTEKAGTDQLKTGPANTVISRIAVGSEIELRNTALEPLDPPYIATVLAYDGTTKTATLSAPIPGAVGAKYHLLNHAFQTANWRLRGNNVHDVFGRMMLYTHDGTFENNRISLGYFHIGFCAADYDYAGEPYNLVFRNNLIKGNHCFGDTSSWWADPTLPIFDDLGFSNNSFLRTYWGFSNTKGTNMNSNYFEQVSRPETEGLVRFKESTAGSVSGNVHYDPVTTTFVTKDAVSDFVASDNSLIPSRANAADVIIDNGAATYTGSWAVSSYSTGQFFGTDYRHSTTAASTAQFTPNLSAGTYRVYAMWNGGSDRAATATYTVTHAGGTTNVIRSQRNCQGVWVELGTFTFNAGTGGNVKVTTTGAGGILIADAVRFQQ